MNRFSGAALFVVGVLLVQAAWMIAVPPFRGSDEFDHAFRAAGVAGGQWRLETPADDGRGLLTDVPLSVARAANAQCEDLSYTGPDNCTPVEITASGHARIATAAGGYHPAFYWVIGIAAVPFDGAGALYAMRVAAALLCLVGIAAAFWALRNGSWAGGRWTTLALLTALTPTLLYTTVIAAPNGIEIVAGLVLWTSLLGLGGGDVDARTERRLLIVALVVTPVLITVRTLGPLWFGAIIIIVAVFHGPRVVRQIFERNRLIIWVAVIVSVATAAQSVWWVLGSATGYSGEPGAGADARLRRVFDLHLWVLQSVGAFPFRNQIAPIWVYPLVLLVLATLLVLGVRRSRGWQRAGLLLGISLTLLIPMLLTWITLEGRGGSWQGRYMLPLAVGVIPLVGLLLDRLGWAPMEGGRLRALAWTMLAVAHVSSVLSVVLTELNRGVSTSDPGWIQPTPFVVGALMVAAWVCFGAFMRRAEHE